MPYRKSVLATGEVYHIFNRSVARQPIFLSTKDYQRAWEIIKFYLYIRPTLSFSHFRRLSKEDQDKFLENLQKTNSLNVELIAYCLMPNHVHFLVKILVDKGATNFMRNFQNSYAKYFNIKNHRSGSLFQSMFKAVRIESDEQLLHVTRYIHLNPLTSYVIKNIEELENYPWCSFADYIKNNHHVKASLILENFPSLDSFKSFTFDQLDYQRELDKIKHLIFD